jgi:hypothetical protein
MPLFLPISTFADARKKSALYQCPIRAPEADGWLCRQIQHVLLDQQNADTNMPLVTSSRPGDA